MKTRVLRVVPAATEWRRRPRKKLWTELSHTRIRPRGAWALTNPHGVFHLVDSAKAGWHDGVLTECRFWFRCGGRCSQAQLLMEPSEDAKFCDECLLDGYVAPSVYHARGSDGESLYLGYSARPDKRIKQHRRASRWAPLAASWELTTYATEEEALAQERVLIAEHTPQFNIQFMPAGALAARSSGEVKP